MTDRYLRRIVKTVRPVLLLLSVCLGPWTSSSTSLPTTPMAAGAPAALPPTSITLHGRVTDQAGNPIPSQIYVIDATWQPVADLPTDDNGYYDVAVPGRDRLSVMVTALGLPGHMIEMEGGYLLSRYFQLTKAILPKSDSVELSFVLPPAAALHIQAYSPAGVRMLMGAFYAAVTPPAYDYQNIHGAFPMNSMDLPMPIEPSVGLLQAAWRPDLAWEQLEPCYAVPVGEAVYLMVLWEVPGIGTFPLRADNRGQGYHLAEGEVKPINLVYDMAETENRRAWEIKSGHEAQGHGFSAQVADMLAQAGDQLTGARGASDEQSRALLSYEVLRLSIQAKEQMTLEVAAQGIEQRKDELTVVVLDEGGAGVPWATVAYDQQGFDFVTGYGQNHPSLPYRYPSLEAGREIGFEYLYDVPWTWKMASPAPGVYDFTVHDETLGDAQAEGWEAVSCVAWLGQDNVPAWAENLPFPEFKQQLRQFIQAYLEHLRGKVKYLVLVVEPMVQTNGGSRYFDVEFPSSYLGGGMHRDELIELIQTVFQAAREVDSGILLGYSADPDYSFFQLYSLPFGVRPVPYPFLQSVLDSGVRPDWIGVEIESGVSNVPLDLSTFSAILQAYHDLSGLPVLVTEMPLYPSRTEDYGLTCPAPNVYWHEGMTQKVQAEWATSVFKIALGLPYVFGLHLMHAMPDKLGMDWSGPTADCVGNVAAVGMGTDLLTEDFQRKQVYYAMRDLFDSWKANGSAVTDASGQVGFPGLGGTYAIAVTTPDGLLQTVEAHLGPESRTVTVTLDTAMALGELQDFVTAAQRGVDWSQHLGRELDYPGLRASLAAARSALSRSDYGSARSQALSVQEAVTITIDGDPADWQGIAPIATALPGGVLVDAAGIDLKALYGVTDDRFLYLMVEVHDPPIRLQPNPDLGGIRYPSFIFDLQTGAEQGYYLVTYLAYSGQMDVFDMLRRIRILGVVYTVAYGAALEVKVPLAMLGNPAHLSVCAFVRAEENGEQKVAKVFEGYADVMHPVYAVYLPLIAGR